jgi:hypothetical protein
MTEKEKIASYIAMCKCCLVAQSMKNCPMCLFNIGLAVQAKELAEQVQPVDLIPLPISIPIQIKIFAMSE